jgi:hypothetical protein
MSVLPMIQNSATMNEMTNSSERHRAGGGERQLEGGGERVGAAAASSKSAAREVGPARQLSAAAGARSSRGDCGG